MLFFFPVYIPILSEEINSVLTTNNKMKKKGRYTVLLYPQQLSHKEPLSWPQKSPIAPGWMTQSQVGWNLSR